MPHEKGHDVRREERSSPKQWIPINDEALMKSLLSKYTADLPPKCSRPSDRERDEVKNILVTGTTGSLGYYLLLSLLNDRRTGTIYCLNRSGEAEQNFFSRYDRRPRRVAIPEKKFRWFKTSFGESRMGLDSEVWEGLARDVDVIVHNAWKVNFNLGLSDFEPQVRGLYHFIAMCLTSPRQPSLYFSSSAGVIANTPLPSIPEQVFPDPSPLAVSNGYTQSKWVCENIMDAVYRKYGIDLNVLRIGQIAGPVGDELGMWKRNEWIPLLIDTSKSLGVLPSRLSNRDIDWIPVDSLADIIVEIIHAPKRDVSTDHGGVRVFNLVNPTRVTFDTLAPVIRPYLGDETRIVTLNEWVDRLGEVDRSAEGALQKYPALRIWSFFDGIRTSSEIPAPNLETGNAVRASPKMRELEAISAGMARTWLRQWKL